MATPTYQRRTGEDANGTVNIPAGAVLDNYAVLASDSAKAEIAVTVDGDVKNTLVVKPGKSYSYCSGPAPFYIRGPATIAFAGTPQSWNVDYWEL